MLLKDRVVIVTGATGGIGRAIVRKLCQEGAQVAGLYRSNRQAAQELQLQLGEMGYETTFYQGDISDETFVAQTFAAVKERYGGIDVLVNNAGLTRDIFLAQMQCEEWNQVFETNFLGSYVCAVQALPYLLARAKPEQGRYSRVISIISVSSGLGREAQTNYTASKGAIWGLTRLLAREYSEQGVYFNAVAPGLIETEMLKELPEHKLTGMIQSNNQKRVGQAEEVAGSVLFLCSSLSDYCNNTVLCVDGGMLR